MREKPKILTLTSSFPSGEDAISGGFVKDLAVELEKKGNEVLILAPHSPGIAVREVVDGLDVRRFRYMYPEGWERLGGRAMLPQARSDFPSMVLLFFLFLSELCHGIRVATKEKVDVLHSHWLLPQGLVGAVIRKITHKPHLLTIHSAGLSAMEMLPFRTRIADFIAKNSDRIVIVSSYGRARFLGLVSAEEADDAWGEITIQPMGVDETRFEGTDKDETRRKYGIPAKDFLVLYVGRLSEVKGVEHLIRAMRIQKDKSIASRLLVVGDGPLGDELKAITNSLELTDRVAFVGRKTGVGLDEYFTMTDVVVVPSIVTDTGDTEGLPVVILEAFAAGKPVIASKVGGVSDAVDHEHVGLLVPQKSPKDISDAIERLMDDRNLYARMVENALDRARTRFSWTSVSEVFDNLMKTISEEAGP
jgi:glycosyltransferase involved in cell wall biosynthesis